MREFPQVSRHLPWRSREFPQVSRHLPWRLRESRKSLGIYRGVCGSSRKSLGICRGVCGSPASLSAFAAGCLRTPANLAGGVCGRRRSLPGTRRPSCRQGRGVLHTPYQTTRYGAEIISGVHPFGPVGPFGGRIQYAPTVVRAGAVRRRPVELLVCWGLAARWFVEAGTRVGAYCIRLTGRHHRWRIHVPGVWSFIPCGMFGGAYCIRPTGRHHRWRIHVPGVWSFIPCGMFGRAYAIRPYTGTCIRPSAGAGLIGISVRLHLVFASGFLSVCEGKGLYVRRACQYVILRISSPPCAWPECSFYRRSICCLSAPYASHGVLEIHEP